MIHIQRLISSQEIACANNLLYRVYIEEAGNHAWKFSPNNPSKLRVITDAKGEKQLVDRFTDKSVWFGASAGNNLIGCCRLTGLDENKKFEFEGYAPQNISSLLADTDRSQLLEGERAAVDRRYKGYRVFPRLLKEATNYCHANKKSLMVLSHHRSLLKLYKKIEWPLLMESAFKYEPTDLDAVNFYLADYSKGEMQTIDNRLSMLLEEARLLTPELFHADKVITDIPSTLTETDHFPLRYRP